MPSLVDVEALLARLGISATRKGKELWACCPFHDEDTPSFQIRDTPEDPERHGLWRCLGACHDGGTAAELARRVLGFEGEREARSWLASGAVRELPPPIGAVEFVAPRQTGPRREIDLPAGVRVAPLDDWPRAAREYAEGRGMTEAQRARYGVGYAVDGRLAGRIVFPWREPDGRVRGWTARAFLPSLRKHDEPAAEDGAPLGWVLGSEGWPPVGERRAVVVVEGAWDGLAVERATGLPWGAARGSNLLPAHAARLATFPEVVVAGDPDAAGRRFAEALRAALGRWSKLRFGEIPPGWDPAKLEARRGRAALAAALGVPAAA